MAIETSSITQLSDRDLLEHMQRAASGERQATAQLILLLMELDARQLYLAEGCSSLFTSCRQVLHLSEHAAYGGIEAARAARRFPAILERLAEGALSLTAVGLLAPHLTPQNCVEVLDAARHKSKRDIELGPDRVPVKSCCELFRATLSGRVIEFCPSRVRPFAP